MANGKKDDAQASAEEQQEMDLGVSFPNIGEEAEETTEASGPEDRLAALEERFQQQIEAQTAAFQQERDRWQQTIDQLIQRSAPVSTDPQPAPKRQELDFNDLPDPVERPQDFKAALAKRFDQALSQRVDTRLDEFSRQSETQQTRNQALDDMWNKFRGQYADLAEKQTTLRGAVMAEQEALRRRGQDPVQGMLADPDGFMDKVAGRMRSELGETGGGEQETVAGRPATLKKPNRTGGLGGGSSTLNGKGKGGGQGGTGFLDQLKKSQLNDGLI